MWKIFPTLHCRIMIVNVAELALPTAAVALADASPHGRASEASGSGKKREKVHIKMASRGAHSNVSRLWPNRPSFSTRTAPGFASETQSASMKSDAHIMLRVDEVSINLTSPSNATPIFFSPLKIPFSTQMDLLRGTKKSFSIVFRVVLHSCQRLMGAHRPSPAKRCHMHLNLIRFGGFLLLVVFILLTTSVKKHTKSYFVFLISVARNSIAVMISRTLLSSVDPRHGTHGAQSISGMKFPALLC